MMRRDNDARRMEIPAIFQDFVSPYTYPEPDYFVCEYTLEEGVLRSAQGGLFAAFGMVAPHTLAELAAAPEAWPLSEEYRKGTGEFFAALQEQCAHSGVAPSVSEMLVEKDGQRSWVYICGTALLRDGRRVLELRFIRADNEKQQLARLMDRSETDLLTQTLNRRGLISAMEKLAVSGQAYAFLMVDIDGFKHYNDTNGHAAGDELLTKVAQRLSAGLKPEDLIARMSGDDFVICICDAEGYESIQRTVRHVHAAVQEDEDCLLSVSMGVAMSPRDGTTFEELYHKADIAMYCAKRRGGNNCMFYQTEMVMPGQRVNELNAQHLLVRYDHDTGVFTYPQELGQVFRITPDDRPLWTILEQDGAARQDTALRVRESLMQLCADGGAPVHFSEYLLKAASGMWRWFRVGMVATGAGGQVCITLTDVNDERLGARRTPEFDEVTGLLSHSAFSRKVERILAADPEGVRNGDYAMLFFDVVRFKGINDQFGNAEGDRLLVYIANGVSSLLRQDEAVSRLIADQYAVLLHRREDELQAFVEIYTKGMASYDLNIEIGSNMGIYVTTGEEISVDAMVDRAKLAQASIKGSLTEKCSFYSEDMRNAMLYEQEMAGQANAALAERQFVVYYQPQYDHSNGELIGAEALVRWIRPEQGVVSPGDFIPLFEKNGFITRLDFFVFEQVCRFQRKCMNEGIKPVPISVNLTRYDIYQPNFIDNLEGCRTRYDVPVELLRIEITETAVVGDNQQASRVIQQLHEKGYVVEMDDFGSGYSSLNVLKDIAMDILKLDRHFLTEAMSTSRSGTILSAIVRMAKWLKLTVIAEGVENMQQADYLRSIGCNYVQGFMYARPMPEEKFITVLKRSTIGETFTPLQVIENMNVDDFWNPQSLDTLIFNNYVGGATIFDYRDGKVELLRANTKYRQELGLELDQKELLGLDPRSMMDDANLQLYTDMLSRAIETGDEEECVTWRTRPGCECDSVCIRSTVRVLGRSKDSWFFFESIRNITEEKNALNEIKEREELFRAASEHVNVYYWEYDVLTGDMRPCFRCVRDLGLPEVLHDYPDSAIELGVFPEDVAEEYREMHRRIEAGEKELEAVLPLTKDRLMCKVRYTTRFDEHGKPVKAYGSAIPV